MVPRPGLFPSGKEKISLPLPGIETRFPAGPAINLITLLTTLSHLQSLVGMAYMFSQIL